LARFKFSALVLILVASLYSSALAQVKLGAIASLQGGASEQGRSWLDGVTLAVEDLNKEGISTKLIVEDDQTQSAKSVTAFNKLTKVDHVNAIIAGTWDFLGEAVYPLALRNKVFTLTPSNQKEILSDSAKLNPFVLTNGLSLQAEEKVLAPFLKASKRTKIAIITVQVPFALAHSELVKKISKELNFELVGEIEISLDDQPIAYKLAAQRISKKRPEVIYVLADYNTLDLFMSEVENLERLSTKDSASFSPIVITTQHLEGAFELSNKNQNRYKDCYGVHPKYNHALFDAKFLSRFSHSPKVFAAEGYDAAQFLVRSFAASEKGPETLNFTYQGLKGTYSYTRGTNSVVEDEAVIVNFKNGLLTEIQPPYE
jgi:ABC-type branched-subunit amino acid transport system substrate-binding protein